MSEYITKRCKICGLEFPATPDHFYRHARLKDGLTTECKTRHSIKHGHKPKEKFPDGTKRCAKCRIIYPLTKEFWHASNATKSGFASWCKTCAVPHKREYYYANRDGVLARSKQQYPEKRDRKIAKSIEWQRNNPERYAERMRSGCGADAALCRGAS